MKSIKHKALGSFVEINGHRMHVFCTGQGKDTLIFLSGHGTSCPTLDFKPLWSMLSVKYKIVVVERFGYGWSDVTNTSRDLDTVLEETRNALKQSDIEAPFMLLPHSFSGLEAIYWAQKYPNEVKAIIGLDSTIPEVYDKHKITLTVINLLNFIAKTGIHKPLSKLICKREAAVCSGYLTEADIEVYIERFRERTLTTNMINEAKCIKLNANIVRNGVIPYDTPIFIFISNKNEKVIAGYSTLLSDYVSAFKNGKYMILDCGHYVHAYEPKKIANEINDYISGIL